MEGETAIILTVSELKDIIAVMPDGVMLELSWGDADGEEG